MTDGTGLCNTTHSSVVGTRARVTRRLVQRTKLCKESQAFTTHDLYSSSISCCVHYSLQQRLPLHRWPGPRQIEPHARLLLGTVRRTRHVLCSSCHHASQQRIDRPPKCNRVVCSPHGRDRVTHALGHQVLQAARARHQWYSSIPCPTLCNEPTRLKARRHHEHIGSGVDQVRKGLVKGSHPNGASWKGLVQLLDSTLFPHAACL